LQNVLARPSIGGPVFELVTRKLYACPALFRQITQGDNEVSGVGRDGARRVERLCRPWRANGGCDRRRLGVVSRTRQVPWERRLPRQLDLL
jgi:hypothetical protein